MDKQEVEKCGAPEDGSHLNRNRSFKTKQLVRSQAIRESTSPPRTVSPSVRKDEPSKSVNKVNVNVTAVERTPSDSSHDSDAYSYSDRKESRKPVEIQITQGAWDEAPPCESRGRTTRWLSDSSRDSTRDLLSNNPRVACVCGACAACPQCRGRRRRHTCIVKQDSGICPDECPDCADAEPNGVNNETRKASSLDVDDQYCRCPERRDKPKSMLSRTDSDDKSEPSGPELVHFIKETLNKSGKDRVTLLKVERELHSLVNDTGRCIVKFPVMTSYGRMLVHRCADLFQLTHHLDQNNKNCVVVSKCGTSGGRIPCTNFKTWCVGNFPPPSPQRHPPEILDGANAKSILKRDTHSLDEPSSAALLMSRSKSLEQREKEYERARRRIFSTDNCSQDESQWPWLSAGTVKLLAPEPRNKLLKVQSLENSVPPAAWRARGGVVSKSHSFGGYGEPQPAARALSRQGDLASSSWRLSPSSSGYKTLSLRSTDSVTPSPTGGGTPEPGVAVTSAGVAPCSGPVVWAVTDMACVPPGALVIHPQTGRPLMNPDGSVYHFDPNNPPILYDPGEFEEIEPVKLIDQNNEKRRGRLEKQHSFIDHEAECQQVEQYNYEYEMQETQENLTEKEAPKPVTPTKARYEPTPTQDFKNNHETNQAPEAQDTANQKASFEPTNQREVKAGSYQDTVYYGAYASLNHQPYNEEVQTPPQMAQYIQPDINNINMQNMLPQAKVAPMLQDPNMRSMPLTNVYSSNVPGYQYVSNPAQCRVDPLQQQLMRYQSASLLQQQIEEQKVPTPPQQIQDNTFRIDPSYPYAPVDYMSTYPAGCVDAIQNQTQPQRSYSVPYNTAEIPVASAIPPVYPLGNVMQPQLIQYPVQYQDAVQWTPVQTPMCPVVYPQHYGHYNILYPQVMPQPYPICQPVFSVLENRRKRNSLPSSARVTPITTPEEKHEKLDRQHSDIAAKIHQIKEGMLQREGMAREGMGRRRDDWKRNSGSGILGSYPMNNYNGRVSGASDKMHLTPTARAIVDSLRHLQARNTYHQGRRNDYNNSYHRNQDRPDYRRRYDRDDINGKGDSNHIDRHNYQDKHSHTTDKHGHATDKHGHATDKHNHTTDKHSHTTEKHNQIAEKHSHTTDKNSNNNEKNSTPTYTDIVDSNSYQENGNALETQDQVIQDKKSVQEKQNIQDIQGSIVKSDIQDKTQSNVPDRIQTYAQDRAVPSVIPDRNQRNVTGRTKVQDRTQSNVNVQGNTQSNVSDWSQSNVLEWTPSNVADRTVTYIPESSVTDRTQSIVQDMSQCTIQDMTQSNFPNIQSGIQDRTQNVIQSILPERTAQNNGPDWSQSNATDRTQSNATDRTQSNVAGNVPDRSQSTGDRTQDRSSYQDRNNSQESRNYQDRGSYQDSRNYQENRNYQDRTNYQDRSNHQDRNNYQDRGSYQDRSSYQDRGNQGHERPWQDRKFGPRTQALNPGQYQYRPPYLFRQMSPATWCRRSPAPVHPGIPHPRRPFPDNRSGRRY